MFTGRDVPSSATAIGGVYCYKDGRTAPDTINVQLQYPGAHEFTATFEATLVPSIKGEAIEMCGTEGRLWIDRSRYEYYPTGAKEPAEVVPARQVPGSRGSLTQEHVNNFVECLKTRARPNGDVLIGHRSAQASHLGNILLRSRSAASISTRNGNKSCRCSAAYAPSQLQAILPGLQRNVLSEPLKVTGDATLQFHVSHEPAAALPEFYTDLAVGMGQVALMCSSLPRFGAICTRRKPGASDSIPATVRSTS